MSSNQDSKIDDESHRLREILRRSRMGLFEDIDDLRDELAAQLEDFETRLRRTALHLPRWLALPDDALRPSFELAETLIGPRTIAMVASQVEDFLLDWLGAPESDNGELPAWKKRDDHLAREQLRQELGDLEESISETLKAIAQLADEGPLELERVLESVVFELEERRELDVEALELLIHDGDVDVGRSAQTEIAELWEEQRRRVGQLQRVWDDILALHHEGITRTTAGLEELEELVARARQGLEGASLLEREIKAPRTEYKGATAGPRPEEIAPLDAGEIEDEQPEEDQPPSEEQDTLVHNAGPTVPMLTVVEELAREDIARGPAPSEPEPEPTPSSQLESNPEPTGAEHFPPEADLQTYSDTQLDLDLELDQDLELETQDHDHDRWEDSQEQWATEPEWAPDPEWEEPPEPEEVSEQDLLRLRTFRIRPGWQEVTAIDMAATLGPPGLFVAIFFIWTLASLAGLAENPMLRFHWALPATFAAMALWALLPLLLRWRPMWSGTKFAVIRRGEVEDEVDLRLTNKRLYFDRISWPLTEIQGFDFHRWEDRDQNLCGWLLTIEPPYQKPLELSTLETDRRVWQESQVERTAPPYQAWQLPPEELDRIHSAIAEILEQP